MSDNEIATAIRIGAWQIWLGLIAVAVAIMAK